MYTIPFTSEILFPWYYVSIICCRCYLCMCVCWCIFFSTRIFHRVVLKRGLELYIDVFKSIAVYVFAFSYICSLKFVYIFVYSLLWKCNFNVLIPEKFPSSTHQNSWNELNIREIVKTFGAVNNFKDIFFLSYSIFLFKAKTEQTLKQFQEK